ncbi:MAG: PAS domain-containing protein [Planctomycetota bacterium]
MNASNFRGGNSRQLARQLDALPSPLAILDRKGHIVFVNAALCELAQADSTALVGKATSWELPSDEVSHSSILSALAPPSSARNGAIAFRQLLKPVVFGSSATGQLFVPIPDEEQNAELFLVLLDDWERLSTQFASTSLASQSADHEQVIAETRGQWERLNQLHPLLGESPEIQLAMKRSQLATKSACNALITGPRFVGKGDIARGIFLARLAELGLSEVSGQYFPVDCSILDANLIDGMLEVFAGRLREEAHAGAQQLVIEHLHLMPDAAVPVVNRWLTTIEGRCSVVAISHDSCADLMQRGREWQQLVLRLAEAEVVVPPLQHRREDIGPLAHHYLAQECRKSDRALLSIAPDTMSLLQAYSWPENIREVASAMRKSVQLAVLTKTIQVSHLPVEIRTFAGYGATEDVNEMEAVSLDDILIDIERVVLRRAMRLSPRNRAQVARWLKISRPRLLRRIAQLGLD